MDLKFLRIMRGATRQLVLLGLLIMPFLATAQTDTLTFSNGEIVVGNLGNGLEIDSNGNLHIYDTYDFSVSNASGLVDDMRPYIGNDAADAIDSILDTMPGFYATPGLSAAGKTRQLNSGGTPNDVPLSGVSQLQNTYQDVVITPQNLNAGNPALYQELKNKGYFDHVDPSLLP